MNHEQKVEMYCQVVRKWERIYDAFLRGEVVSVNQLFQCLISKKAGVIKYSGVNCAYCQAYNNCRECPIKMSTGETQCLNTPYYVFHLEPSADAAFDELEFVFLNPPEGVNIGEGL